MGEDPIIVKPGVYTDSDGSTLEGVCFVFDDSWTIAKDPNVAGGILIKIPPDSRWRVVDDITPPPPNNPSAPEKKKVAIVRNNGTLDGVNLREGRILTSVNNSVGDDITITFTVPPPAPNPTLPS